jgi:arabinan endo-1,5-alpha-L-arabinosidase
MARHGTNVFKDDAGQYYMVHQGRPGIAVFNDPHVRKIFWTRIAGPLLFHRERYAWKTTPLFQKIVVGH